MKPLKQGGHMQVSNSELDENIRQPDDHVMNAENKQINK